MSSTCSISTERGGDEVIDQFSDRGRTDDSDYDPKQKQPSVHTQGSAVPSYIKDELKLTDDHPLCCLLTLEPKKAAAIELAHIIRRSTRDAKRELLRKAWHAKDSFAVDAVENLIYLRADLHRAFDFGYWALFPDPTLLGRILEIVEHNRTQSAANKMNLLGQRPKRPVDLYNKYSRKKHPSLPKFDYRLVWIRTTPRAPIVRPTCANGSPSGDDYSQETIAAVKDAADRLCGAICELSSPIADDPEADDEAFQHHIDALRTAIDGIDKGRAQLQHKLPGNTPDGNSRERQVALFKDASAALVAMGSDMHRNSLRAVPNASGSVPNHPGDVAEDDGSQPLVNYWESLKTLSGDYTAFPFPYTNFPLLRSHIHPLFVIENAGEKLYKLSSAALVKFGKEAMAIDYLYRIWHDKPPRKYPDAADKTQDVDDGNSDEPSERTSQDDDEDRDSAPTQTSEASGSPDACDVQGNVVRRALNGLDETSLNSPTDTPSLTHGGTRCSSHDSDSVVGEFVDDDVHYYNSVGEWAARCTTDSAIELTNDHQLGEDNEASCPPRPQDWKRWAKSPPRMPEVITEYHDTSKLTSYDWSLYHRSVNLLAPYGSHNVPESHLIPWNPEDYDL